MKKYFLTLLLFLIIIICGCSTKPPSQLQIEEHLSEYFREQDFTLDKVTIERQRDEEKVSTIDVEVKMSSPSAEEILRKYSLTYNYYDKGGWYLDECISIDIDTWKAEPTETPNLTKEEYAELLFDNHKLKSDINNVYFSLWSYVPNELSFDGAQQETGEYIYEIVNSGDLNDYNYLQDGRCSVVVRLKATSQALTIYEDISIDWVFNPITLTWEVDSKNSVNHKLEGTKAFMGRYEEKDSNQYLIINHVAETGIISGTGNNVPDGLQKWEVKGLHYCYWLGNRKQLSREVALDLVIHFNPLQAIYTMGTGAARDGYWK